MLNKLSEATKLVASTLLVYSAHFAACKAYTTFCIPDGVFGYIQGLLTTGSPLCKVALDTVNATQNQYSGILLVGLSRLLLSALGI